ncbi:copper amine oxidase N-terminal domain-containing protein [Paenibacillus hunanensis]|uniref:copper amine oxidase N-terminal domain-containing protein n=1 Tax=Paenibacillus hunanensis TaxID=539262 RepID=UPI0020265BB4|nr:copper amine oxidase N-terminal domain-containing protein [Paenibacillus hunanensis]MCL9662282.1 copper amine oxidase N-terminal domain-containing protein [Paenibacillus hunanensis]
MLKRTSLLFILISLVLYTNQLQSTGAAIPAIAPGIHLSINGEKVETDYEAYIVRATQTAYVPIRFVAEGLGGTVSWDKVKQQITIHSKDQKEIILTIDSKVAYVNGETKILSNAPQMTTPRVMVPVRFVSEVMGAQVHAYKDTDDVEHIDIKW